FDGDFFRTQMLSDSFPLQHSNLVNFGYQDGIILVFEQLLQLSKENRPYLTKVLSGCLYNLVGLIISVQMTNTQPANKEHIVEASIKILKKHVNNPIDYSKLSRQFGMSYSSFRKMFKEQTGLAINQYLIRERLLLAQRMVRNSQASLQQVSEQCGFESLHYFSRLYKQKLGITPRDDRKLSKKEN
ncbi:MAG TPA: AraC family transcriptional regulator, partial [Phnomibacter sp.]|nr:AraC family transcriptional regulator [Phnomibacter sp.]